MNHPQINLESLKEGTAEDVRGFLVQYYKKNNPPPHLKKPLSIFIKNCRYRKDDFRPLLIKLGYEMNGGKSNQYILPAMASIHLLLLSFIPIDDVIDGAAKQNFNSSKEFAEKLALAYSLSIELKENSRAIIREYYGNSKNHPKICKLFSGCIKQTDGSHFLEVKSHLSKDLQQYSVDDYLYLVDRATSPSIEFPFVLGGLLAGIDNGEEKTMRDYGIKVGRLAQIRDDFLDYLNPKFTGKIPFSDLSEKRKRFPLLIAYKRGNKSEKETIKRILEKEKISQEDICNIMDMITSKRVEQESRKIIDQIYRGAIKNLQQLPKTNKAYRVLEQLANLFAMKALQ